MNDQASLRKVIILCAALGLAGSLTACDEHAMDKTLADLKAVQVDANDAAPASDADRKIGKKDVELAMQTAKDLTVNEGGLFDGEAKSKIDIAVVDPLQMPHASTTTPLDERPKGVVIDPAVAARLAAAHDLPDVPVMQLRLKPLPSTPEPADTGHRIQVGSFGTLAAAQNAWADLRANNPAASPLSPTYEKVTTPQGKQLFRLKVGPVQDEAKARDLCDRLDVRDSWCAKAG